MLKNAVDREGVYNLLVRYLNEGCWEAFVEIIRIVIDAERYYNRFGLSGTRDEPYLTIEQLDNLEFIIPQKLNNIEFAQNIFNLNKYDFSSVLHMWDSLDKGCAQKVNSMISEPLCLAKFIANKSIQWTGSTIGWEYNPQDIEKYIEIEKALKIMISLKQTELFKTLPKEIQRLVVAFVLWSKPDRASHDIDMMQVQDELINWL